MILFVFSLFHALFCICGNESCFKYKLNKMYKKKKKKKKMTKKQRKKLNFIKIVCGL